MTRIKDLIATGKSRHNQEDKLQLIKNKLAQNSLVELKLGYDDDEFRSKRDVQSLVKVINEKFYHRLSQDKHSCLTSISIGWRLPKFALGPVLHLVIPAFLHEPVRITHLQLILNDNPPIPEWCLKDILSWHSLESVDLRSVSLRIPVCEKRPSSRTQLVPMEQKQQPNVRRSSMRNHHLVEISHSSSISKDERDDSMNWIKGNIIELVPHLSSRVKCLKLMNCGITKHHIPKLCESIRRKLYGLKILCLRQNFTLNGGYHHLFALRGIKILDLSLCDLDTNDGSLIVDAMKASENKDLEQISLAGNYRLSTVLPEIVREAATKLKGMDCSYCCVSSKSQQEIFDIFAKESLLQLPSSPSASTSKSFLKNCTIQYFRMRGLMPLDVEGLIRCIRHNTSLRYLVVDNHHEVQCIGFEAMQKIASALEWNYSLEILRFDVIPRKFMGAVLEKIEFWLQLNRCGRRALLQTNEGSKSWSHIISQGGMTKDPNILFWLLKHGSVMSA